MLCSRPDISELPDAICDENDKMCCADDCGLLYEITECNRIVIAAIINSDFDSPVEWGKDNRTTFEPDKASYTVISRKKQPYYAKWLLFQTTQMITEADDPDDPNDY